MKQLSSVTLIGIDTVDPNRLSRVLTYCESLFGFARSILHSDRVPTIPHDHEVHLIDKWTTRRFNFGRFRSSPARSIPITAYVQHDGWILNPGLWDKHFLAWDFIGAPWPRSWRLSARVGNSGFSLRSRSFCQATATHAQRYAGEGYDVFACRSLRETFLSAGIRYAPLDVAGRFSWEHTCDDAPTGPDTSFGFHGWHCGRDKTQFDNMLGPRAH